MSTIKVIQGSVEAKAFDLSKPLPLQIQEPKDAERVIRFKASDDSLDRHNEVVLPKGWILDDFAKNPVVLLFHDYSSLPVGKGVAAGVTKGALWIDAEFDPPEIDDTADIVFNKIKHGTISAGSVGFIPKEILVPNRSERMAYAAERVAELAVKGIEATTEHVLKGGETGFADIVVADFEDAEHKGLFDKYPDARRIYTKQELLEWTICPVPANPNALAASLETFYSKRFGTDSVDITASGKESDAAGDAVYKKVLELKWLAYGSADGEGETENNEDGENENE